MCLLRCKIKTAEICFKSHSNLNLTLPPILNNIVLLSKKVLLNCCKSCFSQSLLIISFPKNQHYRFLNLNLCGFGLRK